MRLNLCTLAVAAIISTSVGFAQQINTIMGDIPQFDALVKSSDLDENASGVILMQERATRFSYNEQEDRYRYETDYFVRIKVLKPEGVKYAKVNLSCERNEGKESQDIKNVKAASYQWNGKKFLPTKMKNSAIQKSNNSATEKNISFEIPGAKEGAILEYSYTLVAYQFDKLADWVIQEELPIVKSVYRITIPEFFAYDLRQTGGARLNVERNNIFQQFGTLGGIRSKNSDELVMTAENIPPYKSETTYTFDKEEKLATVHFDLDYIDIPRRPLINYVTNWGKQDTLLLESDQYQLANKLDNQLFSVAAKAITSGEEQERLAAVLELVRSKVKSTGLAAVPGDIQKAYQSGQGTSADVNTLLVGALRAAGFDAHPILLLTREKGVANIKHITFNDFNNMVVGVRSGEQLYCLDASDIHSGINILAYSNLVNNARMIMPKGASSWVELSQFTGTLVRNISATLSEDGTLKGSATTRWIGECYYDLLKNDNQPFSQQFNSVPEGITITSDNSKEVKMNAASPYAQTETEFTGKFSSDANGAIQFNPMLLNFWSTSPFTPNRFLPVDLPYGVTIQQVVNIILPENYKVEQTIEPIRLSMLDDTNVQATSVMALNDNIIQLNLTIRLGHNYFQGADYIAFNRFFDELVKGLQREVKVIKAN